MKRDLPQILATRISSAEQRELDLFVSPDLSYFAGHFAEQPILPGIVQTDWAIRWGRECFDIAGDFVALDNLKFQSMVFPQMTLLLVLAWNPQKRQLHFTYTRLNEQGEKQPVSAGRVSFTDGGDGL